MCIIPYTCHYDECIGEGYKGALKRRGVDNIDVRERTLSDAIWDATLVNNIRNLKNIFTQAELSDLDIRVETETNKYRFVGLTYFSEEEKRTIVEYRLLPITGYPSDVPPFGKYLQR